MAYDVILKFVLLNDGILLNLTNTNMLSSVTGSSCFSDGPISFQVRSPLEVHIPYLLQQCVAQFVFQTEVCRTLIALECCKML